jgi:nuclear GTP-binding protein
VAEAKEKRKQERKAANDNGLQAGPVESVESPQTTNAILPGTDDDEVPTLLNPDYPTFQAILDKSDVVIHVLDARDPLPFRSSHLEELVGTKSHQKLLLILNKIGLHDYCVFFLQSTEILTNQTLALAKLSPHGQHI